MTVKELPNASDNKPIKPVLCWPAAEKVIKILQQYNINWDAEKEKKFMKRLKEHFHPDDNDSDDGEGQQ